MRRISVVLGLAGFLGLAVLTAAVIAGPLLSARPVSAQAAPATNVQTFTLKNQVIDCDGRRLFVDSTARFVEHSTTDANGRSHSFYNFTLQGVTAKDADGATIHFLVHDYYGGTQFEIPGNGTRAYTVSIISSGPSDNRFLTTLLHFTSNANGVVTVNSYDYTIECRGSSATASPTATATAAAAADAQ